MNLKYLRHIITSLRNKQETWGSPTSGFGNINSSSQVYFIDLRLTLCSKKVHAIETERDQTTGRKTGDLKPSQDHITILLGNQNDHILLGGHIFVLFFNGNTTLELMPKDQMWPGADGNRRRVVELWKWDESGSLAQRHTQKRLKEMDTWRR